MEDAQLLIKYPDHASANKNLPATAKLSAQVDEPEILCSASNHRSTGGVAQMRRPLLPIPAASKAVDKSPSDLQPTNIEVSPDLCKRPQHEPRTGTLGLDLCTCFGVAFAS